MTPPLTRLQSTLRAVVKRHALTQIWAVRPWPNQRAVARIGTAQNAVLRRSTHPIATRPSSKLLAVRLVYAKGLLIHLLLGSSLFSN